MDVCLVWVLRVVSATGRSLIQRNPTDSGVSEFYEENVKLRRSGKRRTVVISLFNSGRIAVVPFLDVYAAFFSC